MEYFQQILSELLNLFSTIFKIVKYHSSSLWLFLSLIQLYENLKNLCKFMERSLQNNFYLSCRLKNDSHHIYFSRLSTFQTIYFLDQLLPAVCWLFYEIQLFRSFLESAYITSVSSLPKFPYPKGMLFFGLQLTF